MIPTASALLLLPYSKQVKEKPGYTAECHIVGHSLCCLLSNCVLKTLTSLESGNLCCLDLLLCLGVMPVRAARARDSNVPKPTSCTLPPAASVSVIVAVIASRAFAESFFVSSVFSAIAEMSSVFVIFHSPMISLFDEPIIHQKQSLLYSVLINLST